MAAAAHLPEARVRELLNTPAPRPQLTPACLLDELEAHRRSRPVRR
jgi:hypothetical protein